MKPTLSTIKKVSTFSSTTNRSWTIWSKDGGCPFGTVPVKRMTKDDLIRLTRMPPPEDVTFNAEYDVVAIAQISYNPHNKFAGAGMKTAVYNPQVNGQQHSGCRLKIHKGSDILQAGWRVDPTLYGDTKTRFFIHFQAGKIQCFNTVCPGFVQVNHDVPLDGSFTDISEHGGEIWSLKIYINRDSSGNWWISLNDDFTQIGFWPQSLFTDLKSFATNVDWGGVVYSPPGVPKPLMGSSYFPIENSSYDAYCDDVAIVNEEGKIIEVDTLATHTDNPYKLAFSLPPNKSRGILLSTRITPLILHTVKEKERQQENQHIFPLFSVCQKPTSSLSLPFLSHRTVPACFTENGRNRSMDYSDVGPSEDHRCVPAVNPTASASSSSPSGGLACAIAALIIYVILSI
uniref:Neprosin PEP catalytic domain-containing protein n=1 Tax=Solanum lycopersicum TaxID=4081 RepID=A0A3Q7HDX5_SOLLC